MAKKRVGKYPLSFLQMAMEGVRDCVSVSALADELGVHRTILYQWQRYRTTHPFGRSIQR